MQDDDEYKVSGIDLAETQSKFKYHIVQNGFYDKIKYNYAVAANNTLFEKAALLACEKHRGQIDHSGNPYICHLIRVAKKCQIYNSAIIAMLQGIFDKAEVTGNELIEQGFPRNIINAVKTISHRDGESLKAYVRRVSRNNLARAVKYTT